MGAHVQSPQGSSEWSAGLIERVGGTVDGGPEDSEPGVSRGCYRERPELGPWRG